MKVLFAMVLIFASVITPALAQEEVVPAEEVAPDQSVAVVYSNNVEIINGTSVKIAPNTFDISFDLASYRSVLSDVKVGAALTSVDASGAVTFEHEIVLDAVPYSVGPDNSPVTAKYTYIAPSYLTGTYSLLLFSRTPQGQIESLLDLGQVELEATVDRVVTPDSCIIALSDTELVPRTSPVEVASASTFQLRCIIKNTNTGSLTLTPEVTQYVKGQYGEVSVPTQALPPITLAAGEEREVSLPVTAATEASPYFVRVVFKDGAGVSLGVVPFRYSVTGTWAYLTSASLDYAETGTVAASAEVVAYDPALYPLSVEATVADMTQSCVFTAAASIGIGDESSVTIPFASIGDCIPRTVTLTLKDAAGEVRDTKTLTQLAFGEVLPTETTPDGTLVPYDSGTHPFRLLTIIVALAIAAIIGIAYSKRRRLGSDVVGTLLFMMMVIGGVAGFTSDANAGNHRETLYPPCGPTYGPCLTATGVFMGSGWPSTVAAGAPFRVTSSVHSDDAAYSGCPNAIFSLNGGSTYSDNMYKQCYTRNEIHSNDILVSETVTAPTTPGRYRFCVILNTSGYVQKGPYCEFYTVTSSTNVAPVVNAGIDRTITVPAREATPSGQSATDDVAVITRAWTFVSGPVTPIIANAAANNPSFRGLTEEGVYTFRYTATDAENLSSSDTMTVTVSNARPPITHPVVVYAGSDRTITLPVDDVSPSGQECYHETETYVTCSWSRVSGPSTPTITGANTLTPVFNDLVEGTYIFRLTGSDRLGNTDSDDMAVTVNSGVVVPPANTPPVVTVTTPYTVTLPNNTVVTSGHTATDADGSIASVSWTKTAGGAVTITNGTTMNPTFSDLAVGTYYFQVDVLDDDGAMTSRSLAVVVQPNPIPNALPVISAGSDRTITLPTNSVSPTGQSATDPDGSVVSTVWTRVSGPGATITGDTTMNPTFSVSTAGSYVFRLTVTDNSGGVSSDDVQVVVNDPTPPTFSVTPCAIGENQSTCDGRATWDLTAGTAPYSVINTTNNYDVGSTDTGTDVATRLIYGLNNVRARATGLSDLTQNLSIACAAGLFYHSNLTPAVCKRLPVITLEPANGVMWIRSGEQAAISFTITADYPTRCTLSGGVPAGTSVTHSGLPVTQTHSGIMTSPLTAAQIVRVLCETAGMPAIPASQASSTVTVNVVPIIEEI